MMAYQGHLDAHHDGALTGQTLCRVVDCPRSPRVAGFCWWHRSMAKPAPVRASCAVQGCGAKLRATNRTGFCRPHRHLSDQHVAEHREYERRPNVRARRAARRRAAYAAMPESDRRAFVAAKAAAQRAKRAVQARFCATCGRRIRTDSKTGLCMAHGPYASRVTRGAA